MKYQKKPVIIEAVQWTGDNITEICKFTKRDISHLLHSGQLYIETLKGIMKASIGDFIIKGVSCEFYPCKPEVFYQTYEEVVDMWNTRTPEIVRCGECRRYKAANNKIGVCDLQIDMVNTDYFCSYGERREENAKKK